MISSENSVIALAGLAAVLSLGIVAYVESAIGFPGDWAFVVGFILFVLFGFVIPQVYLLRADPSISQASRMGFVTVILLIVAGWVSANVKGTELLAIWSIVGLSVVSMVLYELREGYLHSLRSETR